MTEHPTPADGTRPQIPSPAAQGIGTDRSAHDPHRCQIDLITNTGDYVTSVNIPAFLVMPEMIQWGARYFFADTQHANKADDPSRYREGMIWFVNSE